MSDPPSIQWIGSPHYFARRHGHQPIALVIHTMAGSLAGCDSWFRNPASHVSAHFGVGLDGAIHQYVTLEDSAWGNGLLELGNHWPGTPGVNPNDQTVSIETEDLGRVAQPVTDAQYAAVLRVAQGVLRECPTIVTLVTHRVISPVSRSSCPGGRWLDSGRFGQLAKALGLVAQTK